MDSNFWIKGKRPVTPTHILLLISDLEGSSQHLSYMGFAEDAKVIDEMKNRYYKLYFAKKKSERRHEEGNE